jgi:hypothetical protein
VALGVVAHDGRPQLRGEADQALAERELDAPDRLAVQAVGGREREQLEVGLDEVDRARVGVEPLADQVDDVAQRLVQIVRARDDLSDVGEQCDAIRDGRGCPREVAIAQRGPSARTDPVWYLPIARDGRRTRPG